MIVRERTIGDLDECERLAQLVHDLDGYPVYRPASLRSFVAPRGALATWVAEHDGSVVGHVALHRTSLPAVMDTARRATGLSDGALAVVARLLVSPMARRRGVGRALLDAAVLEATWRGLQPILDVVTTYEAAIRLYEATGWRCLGTVTLRLPDERLLDEYVYLRPVSHLELR